MLIFIWGLLPSGALLLNNFLPAVSVIPRLQTVCTLCNPNSMEGCRSSFTARVHVCRKMSNCSFPTSWRARDNCLLGPGVVLVVLAEHSPNRWNLLACIFSDTRRRLVQQTVAKALWTKVLRCHILLSPWARCILTQLIWNPLTFARAVPTREAYSSMLILNVVLWATACQCTIS